MTSQELANRSLRTVNGFHPEVPRCSSKEHDWEVLTNSWGCITSRCKHCHTKMRVDDYSIMYLLPIRI